MFVLVFLRENDLQQETETVRQEWDDFMSQQTAGGEDGWGLMFRWTAPLKKN